VKKSDDVAHVGSDAKPTCILPTPSTKHIFNTDATLEKFKIEFIELKCKGRLGSDLVFRYRCQGGPRRLLHKYEKQPAAKNRLDVLVRFYLFSLAFCSVFVFAAAGRRYPMSECKMSVRKICPQNLLAPPKNLQK